MVAGDERAFYMFDTISKELEKINGGSLHNFYILREGELAVIASSGETPESLKEHKLKVHPI
ncbi:hypothetical protein CAMRE0001_0815 [Campylobacter rectus RM3267]|uniref:Uncharacterized protein n=2 Tax=Campylobacter rectus TaxID=203 RepID=A0A6G5QM46_CAMRE|nr:hypothetical protein [Campylobacter rectus]EEF12981.1 hypothetical protein CAMRE0001_0815 [Campylobacter rectus RM3267]QCD46689.1 hypothetical protein CRECT_1023 [Campylobacter rectus]UEB47394.1 hypothetical protein LK437_10405 [Campylobacter rectus]